MKDKGHFITSIIKSAIRIGGGILALSTHNIDWLVSFLIFAELFGVAEEFLDQR